MEGVSGWAWEAGMGSRVGGADRSRRSGGGIPIHSRDDWMPSGEQERADMTAIRDVVAIDGPSGAGKSTVARQLARSLGFGYLDTGAMYRAVTWCLLAHGVAEVRDEVAVLALLDGVALALGRDGEVKLDGEDVSAHLRSQEVESRVSAVSALPGVRKLMRQLQRQAAAHGPMVAEGRDMGSVVFPAARWKVYLDANPQERARRRLGDFESSGRDVSQEQVLEEIEVRDHLDSSRRDGPLIRTPDAFYVDTTGKAMGDVIELLVQYVRGRAAETGEGQ